MSGLLSEVLGFFFILAVIFFFIAGPIAILTAGFLTPLLMPVFLIGFVGFAAMANAARAWHDYLDSL